MNDVERIADAMPPESPWWLGIAAGIVAVLCGVIGKLWAELRAARIDAAAERLQREQLQQDTQRDHKRDLRRTIGWSTSIDPPDRLPPPPTKRKPR